MPMRFDVGTSDFRTFRRDGSVYVDKSRLIPDVLEDPARVLLLPRPRRFGKTLNLSMLRYFLERADEDRTDLFEGLEVWTHAGARAHFQRYPVVFLTFKDIKKERWTDAFDKLKEMIWELYSAHYALIESGALAPHERNTFQAILDRTANPAQWSSALKYLVQYLARAHRQKVMVLIDEYDTPIHAAFVKGYYNEMIDFMRDLLGSVLKDNDHVFKGVVTGILRVAKENIFSGLNNLGVYSLLEPRHATSFGFTALEVERLVDALGEPALMDDLREMYNGYLFGGRTRPPVAMYNPWSVMNCLAQADHDLLCYWVDSSSNDLVKELLVRRGYGFAEDMEALLRGGEIEKSIHENIVFPSLRTGDEYLWSLLLFSGYLKATEVRLEPGTPLQVRLAIPNREVRLLYAQTFREWISAGPDAFRVQRLDELCAAMFSGDVELMEEHLSAILLETLSSFDLGSRRVELLYQGFIVGLLVWLEKQYEVRSNPESGYGCADVLIKPRQPGRSGVVLELKVQRPGRTVAQALREALDQIEHRRYAAALEASGASPVHRYAVVFDGKQAFVSTPESWPARFGGG
jgi:hypothetical protein